MNRIILFFYVYFILGGIIFIGKKMPVDFFKQLLDLPYQFLNVTSRPPGGFGYDDISNFGISNPGVIAFLIQDGLIKIWLLTSIVVMYNLLWKPINRMLQD